MNIYVLGKKIEPKIEEKYDVKYISYFFDKFERSDILIINTELSLLFKILRKKIEKTKIIIINLSTIKLSIERSYCIESTKLEALLDSIEKDNYFEKNGVPFRYKYIDKGYDKTLIVLQSSGIKWTDPEMNKKYQRKEISETEYSMFVTNMHRKYVFFKSFEDVEYNLMFVQDNYNNGFGWYIVHENKRVDKDIAEAIRDVLLENKQNEQESVIFGSSKGAYGALILGQFLKVQVLCQYPVYDVMKRYKNNKTKDYQLQFERLKEKCDCLLNKQEDIFLKSINDGLESCSGRTTIITGVSDDDTAKLLKRIRKTKPVIKLYSNLNLLTHGQYSRLSKGQASAVLNDEDLTKFNIYPINIDSPE